MGIDMNEKETLCSHWSFLSMYPQLFIDSAFLLSNLTCKG